ncbi:MAG: chromate transporter, partial [Ignavibacteriaceae bacterium]|nr:chromate transporter [Ignavibacteriaceae bacterium]
KNEFVNKAFSGIKYAIVGMIVAIMYQYAIKSGTDWRAYLMLVVGAALILTFKMHPAFVVLIAAVIGLIIF